MKKKDLSSEADFSSHEIQTAVTLLRAGRPVAVPTETVYGLAADISNPAAIDRIFLTKERPFFDPLIVHIAEKNQLNDVVSHFPPLAEKLAARFWPGPLTLVLPRHPGLNPKITSGLNTVGVRMPRHEMALQIIRKLGEPLAAPSANKFGRTSPTSSAHVRSEFGDEIHIVEGGLCDIGIESTVVGFNNDFNEVHVYRRGAITEDMLAEFAPVKFAASPAAPGQLEHHYMPQIPLVILSSTPHLTESLYKRLLIQLNVPALYPSWMSLPDNPVLAARMLYANLRLAAEKPHANCIILNYELWLHKQGLPAAIAERLEKAAYFIA